MDRMKSTIDSGCVLTLVVCEEIVDDNCYYRYTQYIKQHATCYMHNICLYLSVCQITLYRNISNVTLCFVHDVTYVLHTLCNILGKMAHLLRGHPNVNIFMSVQTIHFFRPPPCSPPSVQTNNFGFQNMGFMHNI